MKVARLRPLVVDGYGIPLRFRDVQLSTETALDEIAVGDPEYDPASPWRQNRPGALSWVLTGWLAGGARVEASGTGPVTREQRRSGRMVYRMPPTAPAWVTVVSEEWRERGRWHGTPTSPLARGVFGVLFDSFQTGGGMVEVGGRRYVVTSCLVFAPLDHRRRRTLVYARVG